MNSLIAHLADLHLGRKSFGDPQGAERLKSLRLALAQLAREDPDAILVAGDSFDSPQVDRAVVEAAARTFDQVRSTRGDAIPVVIIPGNHDPSEAAVLWETFRNQLRSDSVVRLALVPERIALAGGRLVVEAYPCETRYGGEPPWARRTASNGPPESGARVVLAHGTWQGGPVPEGEADAYPFTRDDVEALGAAYVALGHFHGVYPPWDGDEELERSACYAGTHEADQFGGDSGWALLATLTPDRPTRLRRLRVGRRRWSALSITGPGDLAALAHLAAEIEADAEPARHVVRLHLTATARFSPAESAGLDRLQEDLRALGAHVDRRGETRGLVDVASLDLSNLPSGAVKQTMLTLQEEWALETQAAKRDVLTAALQLGWEKLQPAR